MESVQALRARTHAIFAADALLAAACEGDPAAVLRDGQWGGLVELQALMISLGRTAQVHSFFERTSTTNLQLVPHVTPADAAADAVAQLPALPLIYVVPRRGHEHWTCLAPIAQPE